MQFPYQNKCDDKTHRQKLKWNCDGVRMGRELDLASISLCDIHCSRCCRSDTSVGKNLFHMLTRFPASSYSALEYSFDTLPVEGK